MRLFVLRHGQAEPCNTDDFHRTLTEEGRGEVKKILAENYKELNHIQKIWVSPYLRAQQTAIIAAETLKVNDVTTTELLVPEGDPRIIINNLSNVECESILLVSHQPLVSRIIDGLCDTKNIFYQMPTGSLAFIDLDIIALGFGRFKWVKNTLNH